MFGSKEKLFQYRSPDLNVKNLSDIMNFRNGNKVVKFNENHTKTRQGGLRNATRSYAHQMWCTDGGEKDPVRHFEKWLAHRLPGMEDSGPLYLTNMSRPTTDAGTPK